MEDITRDYKFLSEKSQGNLQDLRTHGEIILKWILEKWFLKSDLACDRILWPVS